VTAFHGPALLDDHHILEAFDCGNEHLNTWLTSKARRNKTEGSSRTWVVTEADRVIGFYASSTAVILRVHATTRAARNQPEPLPALLLGRLAVDRQHHRHGLGAALLKHFIVKSLEVSQITGVRLVLMHAKDADTARFYRRYGFEASPGDDLTLMLLTKDIPA